MFTITTYFQILDESLNQSAPEVALKGNDFYIFLEKLYLTCSVLSGS